MQRFFCSWGCGHDGRLGTGNENNCPAPTPVDIISNVLYKSKNRGLPTSSQQQQQQQRQPSPQVDQAASSGTVKNAFGITVPSPAAPAAVAAAAVAAASKPPSSVEEQQQQLQQFLPLKVNRVFCGGYHTFVEVIVDEAGSSPATSRPSSRPGSADVSSSSSSSAAASKTAAPVASGANRNKNSNAILLCFGDNEHGQLGLGDRSLRSGPQIVEPFFTVAAASGAGGSELLFVSTEDQEKYGNVATAAAAAAAIGDDSSILLQEDEVQWKAISAKRKKTRNSSDFEIKTSPYLWYRHEDLIDIRCGRSHSVAWFRPSPQHPAGRIFVCGRNDSGQLGMADTDGRTTFVEMNTTLEMVLSSVNNNNNNNTIRSSSSGSSFSDKIDDAASAMCVLDISCGSNHTLMLVGPMGAGFAGAPCSRSSWTCQFHNSSCGGTMNSAAWVGEKVAQLERAAMAAEKEGRQEKKRNKSSGADENDEGEQQQQQQRAAKNSSSSSSVRKEAVSSFASLFSVWGCGCGDFGELGVDGDERDVQNEAEQRVKNAVQKQHQRKLYAEQEGFGGAPVFRPGGSGDDKPVENEELRQEEDSSVAAVLDPSAAKKFGNQSMWNKKRSAAAGDGSQQPKYRVAMNRPQWTMIDFSAERCKLLRGSSSSSAASASATSEEKEEEGFFTVVVPLSLCASHARSSVFCAVFSANETSSLSFRQTCLTFGAFYNNKRETTESSIPTELAFPEQQQEFWSTSSFSPTLAAVGIEDAELCWTRNNGGKLFIRGGPGMSAIRGGESSGWQSVFEATKSNNNFALPPRRQVLSVVPQGKGALVVCEEAKTMDQESAAAAPAAAAASTVPPQRFTCCCGKEVEIFPLGDNYFGQLGVGDEEDRGGDAEQKEEGCSSIVLKRNLGAGAPRILSLSSGAHHAALVLIT